MHTTGLLPTQVPAWQLSLWVQALPSLQLLPLAAAVCVQLAVASQLSTVQALPSSHRLALQRRIVSSSFGGVEVSRAANSANSPAVLPISIQPSFAKVPLRKPRTSEVTSKSARPVCCAAIVIELVAGVTHGLGAGASIDHLVAPEQSAFLLLVSVSTAQFQVAPVSVHALVRRKTPTVRVAVFLRSELSVRVSSSVAAVTKSCGPTVLLSAEALN